MRFNRRVCELPCLQGPSAGQYQFGSIHRLGHARSTPVDRAPAANDFNRNEPLVDPGVRQAIYRRGCDARRGASESGYRNFLCRQMATLGWVDGFAADRSRVRHPLRAGISVVPPPGGFFRRLKTRKLEDGPAVGIVDVATRRRGPPNCLENPSRTPYFAMLSFYTVHGPFKPRSRLWKKVP